MSSPPQLAELKQPAATPPQEGSGPSAPKPDGTPVPARKRGAGLLIGIGLVGLLMVGGLGGGIWWWLQSGDSSTTAPAASAGPTVPEPATPPPTPEFTLASLSPAEPATPAQSDVEKRAQQVKDVVAGLQTKFRALPVEVSTTNGLIVSGNGERTVDAISRIPRHERWEIQFASGNTSHSYTRQLDFFKIELGVYGEGDKVVYLSNLSAPSPTMRTESASVENRLYLVWQRGSMQEADEEILAGAKIAAKGKVVMHFCPPELEAQLVELEDAHASRTGSKRILKTVFGIQDNAPNGYRFQVIQQKADES